MDGNSWVARVAVAWVVGRAGRVPLVAASIDMGVLFEHRQRVDCEARVSERLARMSLRGMAVLTGVWFEGVPPLRGKVTKRARLEPSMHDDVRHLGWFTQGSVGGLLVV